jgi:hypothetical protein
VAGTVGLEFTLQLSQVMTVITVTKLTPPSKLLLEELVLAQAMQEIPLIL